MKIDVPTIIDLTNMQHTHASAAQGGTVEAADIAGGATLSNTDDTNVTLTLGGTAASALLKAVSLTLGWIGLLASSRGGTGNGFTKFSGPTTAEKTFALPDQSATLVTTATLNNNSLPASVTNLTTSGTNTLSSLGAGIATLSSAGVISSTATTGAGNVALTTGTTWTPNLLIAGGNTGITGTQTGTYSRNGEMWTVQCHILLTSKGVRTGAVRIGGVTTAPAMNPCPCTIVVAGTWAGLVAGGCVQGYISGTAIYLLLGTTTGTTSVTNANLSNTSQLWVAATYIA